MVSRIFSCSKQSMTFTFDAWQFFRFAQPEQINAYLCVCYWAVEALYLLENKRQIALCRHTHAPYASMHTYICHYLCIEGFWVFFFWPGRNKQCWDITWSNISYTTGILNHIQVNPVYITMNTAGDCTVFTKLVHFTHRHLVGGGCRQDNLFILARLKAVIYQECEAPLQMAVWLLQPTRA